MLALGIFSGVKKSKFAACLVFWFELRASWHENTNRGIVFLANFVITRCSHRVDISSQGISLTDATELTYQTKGVHSLIVIPQS